MNAVKPTDTRYDELKNSNNAAGAPAIIVLCESPAQVTEALALARGNGLIVSVRGGGHGFHGKSTNQGGLIIDVGPMKAISFVGADKTVVRVGAGARWGEVATFLSPHRLGISSGDTKQVGVAGLTLGGGIGWMVRRYGLTIDSLVAAEVVAAGQTLRATAREHSDLFWALRGGTGNFGVVTAFEFRTQPVSSVYQLEITYSVADTATVLEGWGAFMRTAPEELSSSLTVFPGIAPFRPEPELRVSSCFVGDEAQARTCYDALCGLAPTLSKSFASIAYADMLHDAPPRNSAFRALNRSGFVPRVDAAFAAAVAAHSGQAGKSITQIRALGGAMSRVAADETAFAHRDAEALLITVRVLPATADEDQVSQAINVMWQPYRSYAKGAYLNFHNDTGEASLKEIYPETTYARLKAVKRRYDPENVFRQTHNVSAE